MFAVILSRQQLKPRQLHTEGRLHVHLPLTKNTLRAPSRYSECTAVPAVLHLKLFRPDRLFAGQFAVITCLAALMVRNLAMQLVAIDCHAVPPILNFLLLFWHEEPHEHETEYKYGSYQTDQSVY